MTNDEFIKNLIQLKSRNMSALEKIYKEYFKCVQQTALVIVKNKDDAYDIATNVFIRLIDYPGDPTEIKNHVGLLVTITKNLSLNFVKRESRQTGMEDIEITISSQEYELLWLADIFRVLSEEEKEILIKHIIWDVMLKDIAKESNKSYSSVRKAYIKIKEKIKNLYINRNF